ncbi:putative benzoyl-CoA reductase, bzd-type, O subunit [delta proteobacterium NaphS2]|nr:putative benzoyl-CoA reductase, bzd-type, O subunit [delta proteobacterium NaphS2]
MVEKKYKTAPLKSWDKAKEIRLNIYKEIAEAKSKGKVLLGGGAESLIALPTGFDYAMLVGEPYGAAISYLAKSDPDEYMKYVEASEHAGYPRDLCAYMRNYIGSILRDKYVFGGPFPKIDFYLQAGFCDTHSKWYQAVSDITGRPYFSLDLVPFDWEIEGESEKTKDLKRKYIVDQIHEAIAWMEKQTGREFNDETFIQGVLNECESTSLWAKVCIANRAIPAPLDEKTMLSLYVLAVIGRPRNDVVEFYRELLDEVEDRVANQIAANPYETARIITDSQPPWFALDLFRLLETYGVVSVGAHYTFGLSGGWEYDEENKTWEAGKTPQEKGVEVKTRDEAANVLADWWLRTGTVCRGVRHSGAGKIQRIMDMVDRWKVDGAIVHLNRGCEGTSLGQMDIVSSLLERGLPTMTYEGNHADPREYDENRTFARIESFMETMGLKQLYEFKKGE